MKNIALTEVYSFFRNLNLAKLKPFLLFLGMVSPLVCFYFLIEFDITIVFFLLSAFAAASTGFVFAKSKFGNRFLQKKENPFFKVIADTTEDIIMIHRLKDGVTTYVTPAIKRLLGYSPDSLIDKPTTSVIHPKDRKKIMQFISTKSIAQKRERKITVRLLEKEKGFRWMELKVKLIPGRNEVAYVSLNFRDISEHKEMEKVSRIFAEELMRKEPDLVKELEVSDQLVSLMTSHELREPLRTISSYIQFLDQKYHLMLDKEGKECLHFVKDAANRMQEMIGDITDFFRMDGNQLVLKRVDTNWLIKSVLKMLGSKIKEKDASVIVGMMPTIIADPRQLQHLFQNLIDNALKYSGDKPEIRISCVKKTSYWEFEVRDNGIGVTKEYQSDIFNAFRRLHSSSQYAGTGVGLTICQRVIDNHNGKIWVKSKGENKGSRFLFSIPFEPNLNIANSTEFKKAI